LLELGDYSNDGYNGSSDGTYLGIASSTGFSGDYINFQASSVSRFKINNLGNTTIGSTTGSGSTSTGALVVSGGVGIGQSLFTSPSFASSISGAIFSNGSATLSGAFIQNNTSTTAFRVRDASNSTVLNIDTQNDIVSLPIAIASTNTSTGSLLVAGGVGISGQLSFSRASFGFTGITTNPTMSFIGATSSSPITLSVLTDNSLSWEGSSGQLFSIDNNLSSGEIFSVSDISGLPIISASSGQTVSINEFGGYTKIGNGSINSSSSSTGSLVIYGGFGITGNAFIGGTTNITNTTTSTSTSSGALVVSGGVGIGGSLFLTSSLSSSLSGVVVNNGVITSGSWAGNLITAYFGGTGLAPTYTVGDILYANTSSTWGRLTASANSGYLLASSGSGATPAYINPTTLTVGFASTATYAYQSGYGLTAGLATTATYAIQSGYAITSGSSSTATTATYSHQAGYAITSGTSALATTATNINVNTGSNNIYNPVLFSPQGTGSGVALSSKSTFGFNPTANILKVSGLAVTSGTASTSPTTGALTVAGGVGISGSLNVGTAITGYSDLVAGFAGINANVVIQNKNGGEYCGLFFADSAENGAGIYYWDYSSLFIPTSLELYNGPGPIRHTATTYGHEFDGQVRILDLTTTSSAIASTSTSTGALTVTGGVGIGQSVSVGGRLQMFNGANYAAFVSSSTGNTVYTLPRTSPATGSSVLQSTSDGVMSWVPLVLGSSSGAVNVAAASGTTTLYLSATNNSTGSGLAVSSVSTLSYNTSASALSATGITATNVRTLNLMIPVGGNNINIYASDGTTQLMGINTSNGWLRSYQSTNSSSTTTGALVSSGGLGVASNAFIGGTTTVTNATASTSTTSGALVVTGGAGIGGSLFASSSNASSISGVILNNGAITNTGTITATGVMTLSNSSTTAFQIRDGSNNSTLTIDTIGDIVSLPVATASTTTGTGSLVVAGGVGIGGSASIGGRLQMFNGANYTAFVSSASGNTVYTLPATSPATGTSVLQSTSAGVMSWVAMTAGGGSGTVTTLTAGTGISFSTGSTITTTGTIRAKRPMAVSFCAGYTPAAAGADSVVIRLPDSPSDGITSINYEPQEFHIRVETASATTTTIQLEKYTGTGAFSGTAITSVSLSGASTYEAQTSVFAGAGILLTSGDKLRINFTALSASHANFSVYLELEEV